jgi:hypothetical protein
MFCPNCGQENPSAFGYCARCQRPLSTVGGAAAMPGLAPTAPPQPRTMSTIAKVFLIVVALLAVVVGMTKPVTSNDPATMAGEHVGTLIALLGLPTLIAYLAAGRRKVRHPNRFALIFCLVAGFFTLTNAASMLLNFEQPEEHFARLLREAAGTQPESHKGFPRQRRFDDAVRQQYRRLVQQNRDYMAIVNKTDVNAIKDLNSAASFASPEAAQAGLDQLHALYNIDADQEQKLRVIMGELRQILESNTGSASEREAMLRGFDSSYSAELSRRQQALDAERAWVDSVDDVHNYANAHGDSIALVNGHLIISDAAVRSEFNAKVDLQEQNRKTFLKAQEQFSQSQAESLKKMGLSGKDVGGK